MNSLARTVTNVLQPRVLLLAGMPGIGLVTANDWTGIIWGLLGALCSAIIPTAYIEWERKRGTWESRHVLDRTKRTPVFVAILSSIGAGFVVMLVGHAPVGVLVAMLALGVMTIALAVVNIVWKVSVHAAVASAVVAMLAAAASPWWVCAYVLVAAICWSRVALAHHVVAETVTGASLGAVTSMAFLLT